MNTKQDLYSQSVQLVLGLKAVNITSQISKSSAGDKHKTRQAMLHSTMEDKE
jgi:hypothetical protein